MNVIFVWKVWKACSTSWKRLYVLTSKLNTRLLHSLLHWKSLWTFSFKNIVHLIVIFHHIYQANQNDVWLNQPAPLTFSFGTLHRSLSLLSLHEGSWATEMRNIKRRRKNYFLSLNSLLFVRFVLISVLFHHFSSLVSGVGKHWHLLWVLFCLFNFPQKRNHFIVRCIYSN